MSLDQLSAIDASCVMQTYARLPLAPVKGKGITLSDETGKTYLDFTAGIAVNTLGYGYTPWVDAVAQQAGTVQHVSNFFYHAAPTQLAQQLCDRSGMERVFFCNSGAEANECAIKIARKYSFDQYGAGRHHMITLEHSFHGRTITTLSATGQPDFHTNFDPFTPGFSFVPAGDFNALKQQITDETCGILLEPVLGEGGVIPLSEHYLIQVEQLCRERDILLILDEVQTGIGRTGSLFAFQQSSIVPDLLTTAKGLGNGLPIGACLAGEKAANVLTPGTHGTTFGSNPVAAAGAQVVLDTLDDTFLKQVQQKGELLEQLLLQLPSVSAVRGKGLMLGVVLKELPGKPNPSAREIVQRCLDHGLLLLTAKNVLRMVPPLIITEEEIRQGVSILQTVMEEYYETSIETA